MDQAAIAELISVRPPYLWLDEVTELTETKIVARKVIDPECPFLQGHYVGFPLFPGALQCEACFQASNVLLTKILPAEEGKLPVIARVRNVKFKQLVRPGQTMTVEVEIQAREAHAIFLKGRCRVAGQTCCSLDFVATQASLPSSSTVS